MTGLNVLHYVCLLLSTHALLSLETLTVVPVPSWNMALQDLQLVLRRTEHINVLGRPELTW